jgi:hypothetical protein
MMTSIVPFRNFPVRFRKDPVSLCYRLECWKNRRYVRLLVLNENQFRILLPDEKTLDISFPLLPKHRIRFSFKKDIGFSEDLEDLEMQEWDESESDGDSLDTDSDSELKSESESQCQDTLEATSIRVNSLISHTNQESYRISQDKSHIQHIDITNITNIPNSNTHTNYDLPDTLNCNTILDVGVGPMHIVALVCYIHDYAFEDDLIEAIQEDRDSSVWVVVWSKQDPLDIITWRLCSARKDKAPRLVVNSWFIGILFPRSIRIYTLKGREWQILSDVTSHRHYPTTLTDRGLWVFQRSSLYFFPLLFPLNKKAKKKRKRLDK